MIKLFLLIASLNAELPTDSLGVETINGRTFVIHRVEEKETLFAISRRYGTTVDAILQYNASAGNGLEIGQILKVPYTPRPVSGPVDGVVHIVAPKETLYSLSRTYQVSMEDIQRWNNLAGTALAVGQELVIKKSPAVPVRAPQPVQHQPQEPMTRKGVHTVEAGETLFSISREYNVSLDDLKEWNRLSGSELKIGQALYVSEPEQSAIAASGEEAPVTPVPQPVQPQQPETKPVPPAKTNTADTRPVSRPEVSGQSAESIRISESLKNGDEIIQGGLAELIEGTEGNRKYLALHRTAPMGTILKVRNEMNNREVFVRVMGKLPDTSLTEKLIIKISKSAYDRLGAIDPRFRVEVTYYK
jgi:LysM repeat protein